MIGYNVTELVAESVARKLETTYHEVLNASHPHPTMSEGVKRNHSSGLWRSHRYIIRK